MPYSPKSLYLISSDGKILATTAGQLRTFGASDYKKIQKFFGNSVTVRSIVFSDDSQYVLSSGVGERYVAIWKLDHVRVGRIEDDRVCIEDMMREHGIIDARVN
ncbi:hypothetical protein GUJ93_ZPchr0013g35536 [Zizania palustris]|uniref:Uncharacterized protein n=1 Tax=Zizania palustris TaxID=103762 RepID=A0A8J6BU17_ZIZPA|nr:hypothetical protein GUJ93_ZPchr0013g35536 [Zizania palustris]